jgi:hypothetical protein
LDDRCELVAPSIMAALGRGHGRPFVKSIDGSPALTAGDDGI